MKSPLIRLGIVTAAIGAVFGLAAWGQKMEFLSPAGAFWIWPSLCALAFLALTFVAFLWADRIWVWPPAAGFVVQVIGILLLAVGVFESAWTPLWYSLGAVATILCAILGVWVYNTLRARSLERRMAEGLAEGVEGNREEIGRIRTDMMDALALLRRAGRGRNAIYELPWFLVMGRPAAGKTVAIKNSGLGLPVRKDWVKGVGGTYTVDWFFTNDLVFLDTPGKWVVEGTDDSGRAKWKQLIKLLKKYRGQRPLDGLAVVVPADDLLSKEEKELEEQAANIRDVVDQIHEELTFRFPVYLLISKIDLAEGFVDFFRGLPAQRRQEILGWSNEQSNRTDVVRLINEGFDQVRHHLEDYRLEMLGRVAKRSQARKLFFFTEEFRALERPLSVFADAFFRPGRYAEAPVFRGFYFTSGTQGEGVPLSRALASLARKMGVSSPALAAEEDEPKRSYFLLDLFRELMVGDEGLVGRTAGHWWRQRRNTMLGAFAPAGLALFVLLLALISFFWNGRIYERYPREAERITRELHEYRSSPFQGPNVAEVLELTGQLRDYHRKISRFSPLRSLGMRRPKALAATARDLFGQEFSESVLGPTLGIAQLLALDRESYTCVERIGILQSVVWLRMGRRWESSGSDDLSEIRWIWDLDGAAADSASEELRLQYKHYKAQFEGTGREMLPGFSLREVSRAIRNDCSNQGATSHLARYWSWQQRCRDATSAHEHTACVEEFSGILHSSRADYGRFLERFKSLRDDLETLSMDAEAAQALADLRGITVLDDPNQGRCLALFADEILAQIGEYATHESELESCQDAVASASTRAAKLREVGVYRAQLDELLEEKHVHLDEEFTDFNLDCKRTVQQDVPDFRRLDADMLQGYVTSSFYMRCMGQAGRPTARVAPVVDVRAPSTEWIAGPSIKSAYTPKALAERLGRWNETIVAAEALGAREGEEEKAVIAREVSGFARKYVAHWLSYVGGLQLKPRRGGYANWFQALATTGEYSELLRPAVEAVAAGSKEQQRPFVVMAQQLEPMEGLSGFVASGLPEYQQTLQKIAEEIQRCERDPGFFLQYSRDLRSGDDVQNSIVAAKEWVDLNAGDRLASGKLHSLLSEPLDAVEEFVRGGALLKSMWTDLSQLYDEHFRARAPFQPDAEAIVDLKGLTAVLGGQSGAVARVRVAAEGGGLTDAGNEWLDRAERLSRLFFRPESDDLRPLRVQLKLEDPLFEPEEWGKKLRLVAFQVHLGQGPEEKFDWEAEEDKETRLTLRLFGEESSDYSLVRGVPAEKAGFLKSTFGKNWKPQDWVEAAKVEGPLAPLKVLYAGVGDGAGDQLQYEIPWQMGKKQGTITVPLSILGQTREHLDELFRLMREGLEPPPASAAGSQ